MIITLTALIAASPQTIPRHFHYSICHPETFMMACDASVSRDRLVLVVVSPEQWLALGQHSTVSIKWVDDFPARKSTLVPSRGHGR